MNDRLRLDKPEANSTNKCQKEELESFGPQPESADANSGVLDLRPAVPEDVGLGRGLNFYTWMVLLTAVLGGLIFGLDIGATAVTSMDGFRDTMGIPRLPPKDSGLTDSAETTNQITMFAVIFHITTLIGALPSGWLSDRFGRKAVIAAACIFIIIGDTWQICSGLLGNVDFAYTSCLLGRAVGGFGNGFVLVTMPVYAAELSPSKYRGQVITVFQLMITIGILIMAFINLGVQGEQWGWRLSIGVQIVPALMILVSSLVVLPESPRFLVQAGHTEEARAALMTLAKSNSHDSDLHGRLVKQVVSVEMNEISQEVEKEKAEGASGNIFDLVRGSALPAFLCGFFIAFCQNITGVNWFMNYATVLFNNLGFDAFLYDTILKTINTLATFSALLVVERLGRKYLTVWGTVFVLIVFLSIAVVTYATGVDLIQGGEGVSNTAKSVQLFAVIMIFVFQIVFAITWGPMGWLVPGEVFPLRLRGVGMGAAVTGNMLTNIACGDYGYQAMSVSSLGLDGTIVVIFCLNLFIVLPVVVFFQPETKGVSLEYMRLNFAFEYGGNETLGHGTLKQFFGQNARQTAKLLTCHSVTPYSGSDAPAVQVGKAESTSKGSNQLPLQVL